MGQPRIPPMLAALVLNSIASQDGRLYGEVPQCPHCGGSVSGYDKKVRNYARVHESGVKRDIRVTVARFRCRECGKVLASPAPFYPGTRAGIPVVDLCRSLSAVMPPSRAAQVLSGMGLVIDRGSIRAYSGQFKSIIPTISLFGYPVPLSLLSIATAPP